MAVNERTYRGFRVTRGDASGEQLAILVGTEYRVLHFASAADEGTDWNVANPSDPRFYVHSETTPATNYGYLEHNGTDFNVTPNAGSVMIPSGALGLADDVSIELGSDDDSVIRHRSASLAANTALTDVLVGTPVTAATPANSLLISNVTADGDIAFFTRNAGGADSVEMLRFDASAGLVVFNEASADVDFRVETNNIANMIFVDAGNDRMSLGGSGVSDVFIAIQRPARTAPANTNYFDLSVVPAGAVTIPAGITSQVGTIEFAEPNVTATGTVTNAETVRIINAPTEGTNNYSLLVDDGLSRFEGAVEVGSGVTTRIGGSAAHATTAGTNIISLYTGTAPAGTISSGGSLYVATATNVELNYIDSGGNAQQLSTT